jgi:protocatechuate 3,4-dioxygenase beta subunit
LGGKLASEPKGVFVKSNRRNFIVAGGIAMASSAMGQVQNQCGPLAQQPKGPFYPVKDQIDKDNDLVLVKGSNTPAKGQVILIQGIVTDQSCQPVAGVLVEIWQACATGKYNHPSDPNTAALDPNFQYWGKADTDARGIYGFRTIVPGAYPADQNWIRPPHVHFKVQKLGYQELISQMYFAGAKHNDTDLILKQLPIEEQKKVVVPLQQIQGYGMPVANFNISIKKVTR